VLFSNFVEEKREKIKHMTWYFFKKSKLWHPELLTLTKFLHTMLHWENRRAHTSLDAGSKPAWETFGRPNSWTPCITWYSPSHLWDKQA
jgi:hypothetical protein